MYTPSFLEDMTWNYMILVRQTNQDPSDRIPRLESRGSCPPPTYHPGVEKCTGFLKNVKILRIRNVLSTQPSKYQAAINLMMRQR